MSSPSRTKLIATAFAFAVALGTIAGGGCARGRRATGGACVDVGGSACQACRAKSTAQFCGAGYVTPVASGNIKVNGQKGCCGFEDVEVRTSCENILRCIRSKGCAAGDSPVHCLCGDLGFTDCARAERWPGACADVYQTALAGGPPGKLIPLFGDTKSPLGIANNTFQCDVDSKCPCDQKK